MSSRELPPIPAEERPEKPATLSQTLMSHYASCPRSALFYLQDKGPQTHPLTRGSIFHEFAEKATELMLEVDEPKIDPDTARDVLLEVAREFPFQLPPNEMDALRAMAHNFAQHVVIDPDKVFAIESMYAMEIAGETFRGKVDLGLVEDNVAEIHDYKTSFNLPSRDEFEGDFQHWSYAVLIVHGEPEEGAKLDGLLEVRPTGVFPRYADDKGLWTIAFPIDVRNLADHRTYLEDLVGKLLESLETGVWNATPSSHCKICPASALCPLAEHQRPEAPPASVADAEAAAQIWIVEDLRNAELRKAIRAWVAENGPIVVGDYRLEMVPKSSRVTDWEGLQEGVEAAVEEGEPFELSDHVKMRHQTDFKKTKVKS